MGHKKADDFSVIRLRSKGGGDLGHFYNVTHFGLVFIICDRILGA